MLRMCQLLLQYICIWTCNPGIFLWSVERRKYLQRNFLVQRWMLKRSHRSSIHSKLNKRNCILYFSVNQHWGDFSPSVHYVLEKLGHSPSECPRCLEHVFEFSQWTLFWGCLSGSQAVCLWAICSDKVCPGSSSLLSDLHPFQVTSCNSPSCPPGDCSYCSSSWSACLTCRLLASGSSGLEWVEKKVMFSD